MPASSRWASSSREPTPKLARREPDGQAEALEQRVGAEAAVAQADAVFGGQVGGHQAGVVTFHGEVDHADGVVRVAVGEDLVDGDAVDLAQPLDEEGPDGGLVGVPAAPGPGPR